MLPESNDATHETVSANAMSILTFRVAEQTYALPVSRVAQIIEMVAITFLPQAPAAVQGVINYRGALAPVVDVRARFGLPPRLYDLNTPIILVDFQDTLIGIVVDQVDAVLEVAEAATAVNEQVIPAALREDGGDGRHAIIGRLAKVDRGVIPVLQIDNLLTQGEAAQLQQAMPEPVGAAS
jgi:purine-binding chemotaxis protein CheW